MRKIGVLGLLAVAAVWSMPASASCELSSARIGNLLIKVGDDERRVLESTRPSQRVQLRTRYDGPAGFRYDYYLHGSTVRIYTRAGRVTQVCRYRR